MKRWERTITFQTEGFTGPLSSLVEEVEKEKIDLATLSLLQFAEELQRLAEELGPLEGLGEAIFYLSLLLLKKSSLLLPQPPSVEKECLPESDDPSLIAEYLHFREIATNLNDLEESQAPFYRRTPSLPTFEKKEKEMESIDLTELFHLFQKIVPKVEMATLPFEEVIDFSSVLQELKKRVIKDKQERFFDLFSPDLGRKKLILFFLALLELIRKEFFFLYKHGDEVIIGVRDGQ